jgi:hypothetical protein
MNSQGSSAPPEWKKTIEDLFDEARKTGAAVGSPEVDWARDYERSLIPTGTRFPKKGDVYEATRDIEVNYLTSWSSPVTGGGSGTLKKGERVIIAHEPLPRPIAADAKPIDYARVEKEMVPESDRSNKKYAGFHLLLKTLELSRDFKLVHEESTPAKYQNPTADEKPDVIARYFLRRLAMAHRDSPSRKPSIQYTNALVETILVFVGMPMIAIASLILIPSIRWAPDTIAKWFGFSPRGGVIILSILSLVVGHIWLGNRFKKYRDDHSAYLQLNSDRDFKIASWQKATVLVACGIILPFLAMLLTFGKQVIARAFELN